MMDLTPMVNPNTTYVHQPDNSKQKPSSVLMNQACNLPDSTTESPTAHPVDSLILPNQTTLQSYTPCSTNQMTSRGDNSHMNALKGLDDSEVEAFRDLISDVSDVSVSVMVDSTQPIDLPQYIENGHHDQLLNYQYVTPNQLPNTHQVTQQLTQNVTQQLPPNVSQQVTPDISQHITHHPAPSVNHQVTQQLTPNVNQQVTQQPASNVTQHVTHQLDPNVTHQVAHQPTSIVNHQVTQQLTPSANQQVTQQLNPGVPQQVTHQLTQSVTPQATQQLTQQNIAQLIQPDVNSTEQKYSQHLLGLTDRCISNFLPDFSKYPQDCTCSFIEKIIPVEQIWVCEGQMYFLPQIGILAIGNREHAGIFQDENKVYIALGEVMEKIMPQYEYDLTRFLQRSEDVEKQNLTPQEKGFLIQRHCLSDRSLKYEMAISLKSLQQMAQFIVMYEGDKPGFDPKIKDIANGLFYKKILQRHFRCGSCGGVILYCRDPDDYILLSTESGASKEESKCFSVGFVEAGGVKFVAFKTDGRVYISLKELCMKKVFKLQGLQARLQALRQRPRLAPHILNNYLDTPQYNVTNTMWIDMGTLRCVCCMGKCAPGLNVDVYSCFARVNFAEHMITNIFGQDDYIKDKAVYTMDPKTFEVVMKKTTMKPKSQSEDKTKMKKRPHIKSFELSSKQHDGYESPEKLNESAFMYEKLEEEEDAPTSNRSMMSSERTPSRKTKSAKSNKNTETYVFDDKDSAIDFLTKAELGKKNIEPTHTEDEKMVSNMQSSKKNQKYVPGKTPTFRVKPAEKPYKFSKNIDEKKDKKTERNTDSESKTVEITMENEKVILTVNKNDKKSQGRSRKVSGHKSSTSKKRLKKQNSHEKLDIANEVTGVGTMPEKDETSRAVDNLVKMVQEFRKEDGNTEMESIDSSAITPRTENRILSRIDLNGSINTMFESTSNSNVLVEIMDTNDGQPFHDSTSPLSRLYQEYQEFDSSTTSRETPEKCNVYETQTNLQSRNEIEMPINVNGSIKRGGTCDSRDLATPLLGDKTVSSVQEEHVLKSGDKTITEHITEATSELQISKGDNSETTQSNDDNYVTEHGEGETSVISNTQESQVSSEFLSPTSCDETIGKSNSSSSISPNTPLINNKVQRSHSQERGRRAKTLSPPKGTKITPSAKSLSPPKGTRTTPSSPVVTNLFRSSSLNSPVFKATGEIDRTHARVQKLSEIANESQPLDLLASLAEVITDESSSQFHNKEFSRQSESCAISDENANVEKVTLPVNTEIVTENNSDVTEWREKILMIVQEVENHVTVTPYRDQNTGHWKVKIQLKPGAKEAFPGLFSEEVDTGKRNMFLAMFGKLYLQIINSNNGVKKAFTGSHCKTNYVNHAHISSQNHSTDHLDLSQNSKSSIGSITKSSHLKQSSCKSPHGSDSKLKKVRHSSHQDKGQAKKSPDSSMKTKKVKRESPQAQNNPKAKKQKLNESLEQNKSKVKHQVSKKSSKVKYRLNDSNEQKKSSKVKNHLHVSEQMTPTKLKVKIKLPGSAGKKKLGNVKNKNQHELSPVQRNKSPGRPKSVKVSPGRPKSVKESPGQNKLLKVSPELSKSTIVKTKINELSEEQGSKKGKKRFHESPPDMVKSKKKKDK